MELCGGTHVERTAQVPDVHPHAIHLCIWGSMCFDNDLLDSRHCNVQV